jgi:hypothetical protein
MKAFPNNEKYTTETNGMDLRDYFAAKAMNGYLSRMSANPLEKGPICLDMHADTNTEAISKASYLFADAMMKARDR